MGELWLIIAITTVYLIVTAICCAGYASQNKKNHARFVLGFVPVINIIIALSYMSLFLQYFRNDTISGIFEEDDNN